MIVLVIMGKKVVNNDPQVVRAWFTDNNLSKIRSGEETKMAA